MFINKIKKVLQSKVTKRNLEMKPININRILKFLYIKEDDYDDKDKKPNLIYDLEFYIFRCSTF